MSAYALAAELDLVKLASPPTAKARDPLPSSQQIELEPHSTSHGPSGPQSSSTIAPTGTQTPSTMLKTPKTPNEVERSEPVTPTDTEAARVVPSWSYPRKNRWRVLSACLVIFGNGMNDASAGPLIPYMESRYHVGYAVVSLIFVSNAVGFVLAAFFVDATLERLGRAKAGMLSELIIMAGCVMIICTPPFGVVVAAYLLFGFGQALNLALNNVWCSNLANSTVILGAVHGSYGIGGIISPLIATTLVSHGHVYSRFFLITLGARILCLLSSGWSFHNYELEPTLQVSSSSTIPSQLPHPSRLTLLKRALHNRTTLLGALFIFAYQGAEVSISGWIISYLITSRHGQPARVGYVTSGFWAGITLGRFALSHLATRVGGERRFVYGLVLGSLGFQLLVWFVPNVVGDAVAVAVIGVLLGPLYPCASTVFARLLGRGVQTTAMGFIASAGSSGGAVAPFVTGLLAQAVGTWVLNPICVVLYVVVLGSWFGLPEVVKRSD